jgi:hypothetical protein
MATISWAEFVGLRFYAWKEQHEGPVSPPPSRTELRTAATAYGARGWVPIPLVGKDPYIREFPTLRVPTPEDVERVYAGLPSRYSNLGLLCAEKTGLAVLDVDPRHGGFTSLDALEKRWGVLPETLTAFSGGGGAHLVYRHPGGKLPGRLGDGLDVKANNGVIVVAPSVHPETRRRYRWTNPGAEIARWPDALIKAAEEIKAAHPVRQERPTIGLTIDGKVVQWAPSGISLGKLCVKVAGQAENNRNNLLNWAANVVAGPQVLAGVWPLELVVEQLTAAGVAAGLPERGARATVLSGLRGAGVEVSRG